MVTSNTPMAKIAVNKSLCKEFKTKYCDRSVYLQDAQEFQIALFNPTQDILGIDISINGTSEDHMLVIKPGERIWLDRFIDENRKFRTDVYSINPSDKDAQKAIEHNGEIVLKFYKERKYNYSPSLTFQDADYIINGYGYNINTTGTCLCNAASTVQHTYNTAIDHIYIPYSSSVSSTSIDVSLNKSTDVLYDTSTTDTARIGKGSVSNQTFKTAYYNFDYTPFVTEHIKILPKSIKPVFKSDVDKKYCPYCGKKLKSSYKFCPQCGKSI